MNIETFSLLQGMDVHDCSRSNKKRPLESGMVITVEPGVYIPNHKSNVDSSWWGLGCRSKVFNSVLLNAFEL